jgi:hypothetical protein
MNNKSNVKIGQRWYFNKPGAEFIVEILNTIQNQSGQIDIKVIQVIGKPVGRIVGDMGFANLNKFVEWELLEGQDAP